jgi:hypothetical protein
MLAVHVRAQLAGITDDFEDIRDKGDQKIDHGFLLEETNGGSGLLASEWQHGVVQPVFRLAIKRHGAANLDIGLTLARFHHRLQEAGEKRGFCGRGFAIGFSKAAGVESKSGHGVIS